MKRWMIVLTVVLTLAIGAVSAQAHAVIGIGSGNSGSGVTTMSGGDGAVGPIRPGGIW